MQGRAQKVALCVQAEATALAQPQIEGADIDCNFKGLDVLPLAAALDRGAAAKTQRLKLNGRTKFSVRLTPQQALVEGKILISLRPLHYWGDDDGSCNHMHKEYINTRQCLASWLSRCLFQGPFI